jgi:hypothetical protein
MLTIIWVAIIEALSHPWLQTLVDANVLAAELAKAPVPTLHTQQVRDYLMCDDEEAATSLTKSPRGQCRPAFPLLRGNVRWR